MVCFGSSVGVHHVAADVLNNFFGGDNELYRWVASLRNPH